MSMDLRMDQVATVRILMIVFGTTLYFRVVSPQPLYVADFNVDGTSYDCNSKIICLGSANGLEDNEDLLGLPTGTLSLIANTSSSRGIAYYKHPVKLFELSSNQLASLSTSFTIEVRPGLIGDGMRFLMTNNNSYIGYFGECFGIFSEWHETPFKSIVVEFNTYDNYDKSPIFYISDNHVSFDFSEIQAAAGAANASDVSVQLGDDITKYALVDYDRDIQLLEVRVSYDNYRPISALLNLTVNILDFVDEYMWVGFSSASGPTAHSNFYIGDWTFTSSGIPLAPSPAQQRDRKKVSVTMGISMGMSAFLLVGVILMGFIMQRRSFWRFTDDPMMQIDGMPERFSYEELSVATKGFSDKTKLGQGGFGTVYRGELPSSGLPVAVKKIKSESNQGEKEFMTEVSTISQLRHRNLIQLHGWCKDASKDKYLLVYELMPNGSLDKVLFRSPAQNQAAACLSWEQRFNIVTGTAAAVDYLHQGWKQQVIHRDIKSSNIMLDEEWNAKLGDFGLARLVDHKRAPSTTIVAGTYGYIAPEAASPGRFTDKTDVYAFGAVVLEIACGRRALSTKFPSEEILFVDWVWKSLSEGALLSTVDKRLVEYDPYWMNVILSVGLLCSSPIQTLWLDLLCDKLSKYLQEMFRSLRSQPPSLFLSMITLRLSMIGPVIKNPGVELSSLDLERHRWYRQSLVIH